jgi:hypothetical protein
MRVINAKHLLAWRQQGKAFFEQAILEADGTLAGTTGACKKDMDLSYKGTWGYHPLLISLANTQEPLFLLNRPASRPSHEGAAPLLDQAIDLCRRAGFRKSYLIEQLKNGVKALRLPSNTLEANGAYRVSGALAWSSKAWVALWQPRREHRDALLGMEFKQFLRKWLSRACQVARGGRRMIYRVVQDNEWVPVLWRTAGRLRQLRLT